MTRENNTRLGVRDAWDFWLSQHDVTVPDVIEFAVKAEIREWLHLHGEDVFRKAFADALSIDLDAVLREAADGEGAR